MRAGIFPLLCLASSSLAIPASDGPFNNNGNKDPGCSHQFFDRLNEKVSAAAAPASPMLQNAFVNWTIYRANGVGLPAWLEQEATYDIDWWAANVGTAYLDEWSWCGAVGFDVCGPKLEQRYASFITTADIDKMASLGINTLRIPTTYAAWIKLPTSRLYSGKQQEHLSKITNYAIDKHNMHVIIGLQSLPGGVNNLTAGEAFGHHSWFFNDTNLANSYRAIDSVLAFIGSSNRTHGYTISPINEPSDNVAGFATAAGLTENGTNWITTYIHGVLSRIEVVDKRIPLMLQDAFLGETYWSSFYPAGTNLVIDSHVYFFRDPNTDARYAESAICDQAMAVGLGDGKFPVFIGEWSLQSQYQNRLASRKLLYDTQIHAYQKYASGSSFWGYKMLNDFDAVHGQGKLQDYWSWSILATASIPSSTVVNSTSYC